MTTQTTFSTVPATSITLLRDIASSAESARWTEFFRAYEPAMRGFLHVRYPTLEADDVLQEAMLALARALPGYRYAPDAHGHFRNYLMGIVRHKATDALRRRCARDRTRRAFAAEPPAAAADSTQEEEAAWRLSALEVALAQLMADPAVAPHHREIFRHVVLRHEPPEAVAAAFGLTRGNVDQIKHRLVRRLAEAVASLRS